MPKKNPEQKKSKDSKVDSKSKILSSKKIPSSCRDESTSAEGNYCSIPAAVKNEESSNDSKRREKAVSDEATHFPGTSEGGESSHAGILRLENEGLSAGFLPEARNMDDEENLKTADNASIDDFPVIHGEENITSQEGSSEASLLDSELAGRATKNENVCEQMSSSAKASQSEDNVSQDKSSDFNLSLDSTIASDERSLAYGGARPKTRSKHTVKEDRLCGSKKFAVESSLDEDIIHQEKPSDEVALSSVSEVAVSETEEKVTMKDKIDSTFQADLNPCSRTRSRQRNKLGGDSTEQRPKSAQSTSSLGAVNTDSQSELFLGKGQGKKGTPFKHATDVSGYESQRKRTKTTTAVTPPKASQKKKNKSDQKLRTKSDQTAKTTSEFLTDNKREEATSSPGTSFQTEAENVGREDRGPIISHQDMSTVITSNTCNSEKEESGTQSKCFSEVSPRKRKSSDNTTSFSTEKVLEAIPPKRVQKGSETLSSTLESKSSPKTKKTPPKKSGKPGKKSGDKTTPDPPMTVETTTISITEYVGDAAFIAVGETPPLKHEDSVSTSHDSEISPKNEKYKIVEYKSKKSNKIITSQTLSMKEYLELPEDNSSDGEPKQPVTGVSSTEVLSRRAECLHTASSIPHRNLNVADTPATQSAKYSTERESERSPTVSSRENRESDFHNEQERSVAYGGARPKTRSKPTQETSPQKGSRKGHVSDTFSIRSPESSSESERSPTVSSSENIESDFHNEQERSVAYGGARPKTRSKHTQETSPQKGSRKGRVSYTFSIRSPESSTEADSSPADSSREDGKETDNYYKQSSSTTCKGARPKTRGKNIQISPPRGDDIRPLLAPADTQRQSNSNELFPSFEEFKETLGVDKVEVVNINYDVFDKALGIDRSSDHSVPEHRKQFKIISPKRFSEAVSYYNGKNSKSIDNVPGPNEPQSSEMVEQEWLPTIEEFRKTLRADEIAPIPAEQASEILNRALEGMESKQRNLRSEKVVRFLIPEEELPSTSARSTSPEEETDEATTQNAVVSRPCINREPIPGILPFSGYRVRGRPVGLAVPDCFDLKSIADALDEVLRSVFGNTAGEARKDPRQPEVFEDSDESIEDINRAIAKSGMKLKRSHFISSDDEFTPARTSEPGERLQPVLARDGPKVAVRVQRDSAETSQSSDENSQECSGSSSKRDETSSESLDSDEKSTASGQKIGEFPQIGLERSPSERHLHEPADNSDNVSPSKRPRKDDVEKSI